MEASLPANVSIRWARDEDVEEICRLNEHVGWNFTPDMIIEDAEIFGWDNFLVAVDDSDRLIGLCSAYAHGKFIAQLGLVIVTLPWQRRGIARVMLTRLLHHLGSINVVLDSIPEYTSLYSSLGFTEVDITYMTVTFKFDGVLDSMPSSLSRVQLHSARDLFDYDKSLHTLEHRKSLERTVSDSGKVHLVAKTDGKVMGYLVSSSYNIGLYADSVHIASDLLHGLLTSLSHGNGPTNQRLFVPASKVKDVAVILTRFGASVNEPTIYTHKMTTKGLPSDVKWHKIFSVLNIKSALF